jgi:transmembrane sensor
MTTGDAEKPSSAAVRAEAAAWVARLHGPNRTVEVEAGLRRWLKDDPERARAFELLTDTWEKSARLQRRPLERISSWDLAGFRVSFSCAALAMAVTFAFAVIGTLIYLHSDEVITDVGELRTLTLDDGTRVHLNTNTRLLVRYDKQRRDVSLESGEALFEVAKDADRPFVVTAGQRQIRALGTQFVVREDAQELAVTLVQGKVLVSPPTPTDGTATTVADAHASTPLLSASPAAAGQGADTFTLNPGERLTFVAAAGSPKIDRPPLERVTAWERGQVALDNTPLADAAAEMNRYSRQRIVVGDTSVAAIHVSGVFQAGDSANFVQALAATYHLKVTHQGRRTILTSN